MRQLVCMIMLLCWLLLLGGCHWFNPEQETTPPLEVEDEFPLLPEEPLPVEKERRNVVVLGVEGIKQEVEMATYSTSWLSIEYEQTLQVVAEEEKILFFHQLDEAQFEVRLIENQTPLKAEQSLLEEQGYELANSFQLENGEGYIYYLYQERHQVELYHLQYSNGSVLVRMQFVEATADQYQFIFDHMMASILLKPAVNEGDAANENEK